MTAEDRVRVDVADGVAHMRLVRGAERNAIDIAMVLATGEAVTRCEADPTVRAVLLTAEGPSFTVGGDLRFISERADGLGELMAEMIPAWHDALERLAALPVPVVCAVRGAVAGGGLGLAYCSDFVLAAPRTRFATGFGRLGLSGDGGSTWFLPRLVGLRRALELMVGGRVLSAEEALEWGVITAIVPEAELEERAAALAGELAQGPTLAYGLMRRLLRTSMTATLSEGFAAEADAMVHTGSSADAKGGVRAFVDGRTPRFQGR
jgi:2-(1,2-epoxy-1,2-dihydrophenyl)acetyl-CoA isomerase